MIKINKTLLNFKPFFELGFTPKVLESLIFMLLPQIQKDLILEFRQTLSEKEIKKIAQVSNKKFSADSEEMGQFWADYYLEKTGKSLENRGLERLQEYLEAILKIIRTSASNLSLVAEMTDQDVVNLKKFLDANEFEKVNSLLVKYSK